MEVPNEAKGVAWKTGFSDWTRTNDPQINSLSLSPTELLRSGDQIKAKVTVTAFCLPRVQSRFYTLPS